MYLDYFHTSADKTLLFAVHWQPVLGQVTTQQIRQLCKYKKAKGWVIGGQNFLSIGLTKKRLSIKKEIYAAAICYALVYPRGLHATIYKIDDAHFWLIAVQEGTPIKQSDKLYATLDEAKNALILLIDQYPELNCVFEPFPIDNLLASLASRPILKALMKSYTTKKWKLFALIIVILGGVCGWQWQAPTVEAAVIEPEVDPYLQYWNTQAIAAHNHVALHGLLEHWHHMPLYMAKWRLDQVDCVTLTKKWQCQHLYVPLTPTATVMGFERVLPDSWSITDVNLQKISVKSEVEIDSKLSATWRSREQVNMQLLSQLQHIRSAFINLKITDPQLLLTKAPLVTNPTFTSIFSQKLHFQGPLRSLVLLRDFDEALYWRKASLKYIPNAKTSLKNSALQANLQGVIYVRD